MGIDNAPPVPMQIGDPARGDFRGYEVDLLHQIASKLECQIEYRQARWSVIIRELSSGQLDIVCSAATVTAERKKDVDFCTPHLLLRLALVVRNGTTDPLDLRTSRLGVRRGTTAEAFVLLQLSGLEPAMVSESNEDLYAALADGRLDGVVDDSPIAMHFAAHIPGLRYQCSCDGPPGEYAVVIAKGSNTLKDQINAVLAALETEGTLRILRKRWFGSEALLVA